MHRFGSGPRPVLVFGGIHGDERNSAEVADALVRYLREGAASQLALNVAIIPSANPDGLAAGERGNARGVDCNRNFPARNWSVSAARSSHGGASAGSEPETRALIRVVNMLQPRAIISIHSITRGRECNNYDGPARQLAEIMSRHNRYPPKASIGYPTPGSFGSWAGIDQRYPVITLELPKKLPGPQCWDQNRDALLAAIGGQQLLAE